MSSEKSKFSKIVKAAKDVIVDPITKSERKSDFVDNCKKILKSTTLRRSCEDFAKIDNVKPISVTRETLRAIYGSKGLLQEGVNLRVGDFSDLAVRSRAAYKNIKLESKLEQLQDFIKDNNKEVGEELVKVANAWEAAGLGNDEKATMELKNTTEKVASGLCKLGVVAGLSNAAVGVPFLALANTTIFTAVSSWGWEAISLVETDLGCVLAGSLFTGIGLGAAALMALIDFAIAAKKKYDYNTKVEELKKIDELVKSLKEIEKKLEKTQGEVKKVKVEADKLKDFIRLQGQAWTKYLNKREKRYEKLKRSRELGKTMDGVKLAVAKLITAMELSEEDIHKAEELLDKATIKISVADAGPGEVEPAEVEPGAGEEIGENDNKADKIKKFENVCGKILNSPSFKNKICDGIYKINDSTVFNISPRLLEVLYGQKGFLRQGVKLNIGDYSKLAKQSCEGYGKFAENLKGSYQEVREKIVKDAGEVVGLCSELPELWSEIPSGSRNVDAAERLSKGAKNMVAAAAKAMALVSSHVDVRGIGSHGEIEVNVGPKVEYIPRAACVNSVEDALRDAKKAVEKLKKSIPEGYAIRDKIDGILVKMEAMLKYLEVYEGQAEMLRKFVKSQDKIWKKYGNTILRRRRYKSLKTKKKLHTMDGIKLTVAKIITQMQTDDAVNTRINNVDQAMKGINIKFTTKSTAEPASAPKAPVAADEPAKNESTKQLATELNKITKLLEDVLKQNDVNSTQAAETAKIVKEILERGKANSKEAAKAVEPLVELAKNSPENAEEVAGFIKEIPQNGPAKPNAVKPLEELLQENGKSSAQAKKDTKTLADLLKKRGTLDLNQVKTIKSQQ